MSTPPPSEFSFAFAFVILRVINLEIILSRFAFISVSMVTRVSKRLPGVHGKRAWSVTPWNCNRNHITRFGVLSRGRNNGVFVKPCFCPLPKEGVATKSSTMTILLSREGSNRDFAKGYALYVATVAQGTKRVACSLHPS